MTPDLNPRNRGPSWGFRAIIALDRWLPEAVFKPLRQLGSWMALGLLTKERRNSRAYLQLVLDRRPGPLDGFRHFFAFTEALVLKLRVANGRHHEAQWAPGSDDFRLVMENQEQALLGSLHLGHSDVTGFLFASRLRHRIAMVRERRGNAGDVDRMLARFGGWVTLIWVNESENLLFALKAAIAEGRSVAMKCDRHEYSAKTDVFHFLGARRRFPTTIYHLGLIFNLPVLHAYGMPGENGRSVVYSSPAWRPDPQLSRSRNLELAHEHFQAFLGEVETVLRQHPYQWFNFIPLNPAEPT
jgi:predicted LPLAT superfamily acyltransferase